MRRAIKFEISRAFYNKNMLLALIMGFILACTHFIIEVLPKSAHILVSPFPWTIYGDSMVFDGISMFSHIYNLGIILFASIPFVASYYNDIQTGFIKNICLRMKKRDYLLAKYIAVFISAGTAGIAPAVINMMLTMTVLPALTPQGAAGIFPIFGHDFMSEIYYQAPMLYVCLYFLIGFMFSGVLGCMALIFAKILNHKYMVFFSPFMVYFSFHAVLPLFALERLDIMMLLRLNVSDNQTWGLTIGVFLVLFIVSFVSFYWKGCRDDII